MSVAQQLQEVKPFFMQTCPLCSRSNRIIVLGMYRDGERTERYPDIGYSFCNCKNIFYTNFSNIENGISLEESADPVIRMRVMLSSMASGQCARLVLPDPFFCEWGNDPYKTFLHWNPRVHWIIWDKDQFEQEMRDMGFEIVSCKREFDVQKTESQQTFEIVVRKP